MSIPRPRRALADVLPYRAGRPAPADELKLSSNELPFAPLPGVIEAAMRQVARAHRYPDPDYARLRHAVADHHGVTPAHVVAGTGSVAVLAAVMRAFCAPGDEVVMAWRSFEAYPIAVRVAGAVAVPVPLRPDATHDIEAMIAAVTDRTKVMLVCTPNNPTGPVVTAAELAALLDAVPASVLVVVDEAYIEFVRRADAGSGLDELARRDNVMVLRTFSKAHGLAGLRVGYGLADPSIVRAVGLVADPFGVTDVASAAAVASLARLDEVAQRVETVVGERDRVVAAWRSRGWPVPDAQGNFVWLPVGDRAFEVAAACGPLSVRPFDGEGVRVTIGAPVANDRLLDALDTLDPLVLRGT